MALQGTTSWSPQGDPPYQELIKRSFVTIGAPKHIPLDMHIDRIVNGMKKITGDPLLRRIFEARVIGHDEVGNEFDAGLWDKTGGGGDRKWFYHHWPVLRPPRWRPPWHTQRDFQGFFASCDDVGEMCHFIAVSFAHAIDPALAEAFRQGTWVLRCLQYPMREDGLPDAKVHFDRDGITVHVYGSDHGLMLFDRKHEVHVARGEPDKETLHVMLGKKCAAMTGGAYGLGTLHGVRRIERVNGADIGTRFVIVVFVHPRLTSEQAEAYKLMESQFDSVERAYANAI